MNPIVFLLTTVINLYIMVVFAAVIVNLLLHFRILNTANPIVFRVNEVLEKLTEPVLRKIREKIPPMSGLDLSPLILLIGLHVLDYTLHYYFG